MMIHRLFSNCVIKELFQGATTSVKRVTFNHYFREMSEPVERRTRGGTKRKIADIKPIKLEIDLNEELPKKKSTKTKSKASKDISTITKTTAIKIEKQDTEAQQDQPSKDIPTIKKTPALKKEKPESKAQLDIPDIKIPVGLDIIAKAKGPNPWNGSIQNTNQVYIGAHISAAGGLENSVTNAVKIGALSFALFLKSQRQWNSKPLEESTVIKFKDACAKYNISPHLILPHGSYLMNLGSHDPTLLSKSRAVLLDEIQRCDRLGLLYFNIHPGSTCGKISRQESIQNIADSINWVHQQTTGSRVSVVLENMCRQGHTIGGDLSELASIIELTFDRSRVGVCIDTCHALAAGYDLVTADGFQSFLDEFERIVGFQYLVAVHLNDSEGPQGCSRDRHASIGKGHIGKAGGFERIMNCERFRDIPIILETPFISDDVYRDEILLLKSMISSNKD